MLRTKKNPSLVQLNSRPMKRIQLYTKVYTDIDIIKIQSKFLVNINTSDVILVLMKI